MLLDLLTADVIRLGVEAKDSEAAIRAAGNILVDKGYVKKTYVDAMVQLSKDIPGYIVLAPGLAMPHARPESGVLSIAMSLITLTDEVCFGNCENDPVKLVIALAAIDNNTHLQLLQEFSEVFGDTGVINRIIGCAKIDDVLEIIKTKLEETVDVL